MLLNDCQTRLSYRHLKCVVYVVVWCVFYQVIYAGVPATSTPKFKGDVISPATAHFSFIALGAVPARRHGESGDDGGGGKKRGSEDVLLPPL